MSNFNPSFSYFLNKNYSIWLIEYLSRTYLLQQTHNSSIIENFKNKNYYNLLDDNILQFINNNVNWGVENQIGYLKADTLEQLKIDS